MEAPLIGSFKIKREKKKEKVLLGIILQNLRYATMSSKDFKDREDHNNPLIAQEIRQENSNGPFWPHAVWLYRSRSGQQLQASSQNWGEAPSEPETDSWFCVEWEGSIPETFIFASSLHTWSYFALSTKSSVLPLNWLSLAEYLCIRASEGIQWVSAWLG